MIYTLTVSLLIDKPFYLLRQQSFSFQIVSEFIDIFVKSSNFMSRGGAFDFLFFPRGGVLYTVIVLGGGIFPLRVVSLGFVPRGSFWMKLIPVYTVKNAWPE